MVADYAGTDHHEVIIGQREFLDFLPHFVRYTDEPLADLASIPLYYVSQLARQKVTVALSGEGSDEILGGYSFEKTQQMWDQIRSLQSIPPVFWKVGRTLTKSILSSRWQEKLNWLNSPEADWLRKSPFNMTHFLSHQEQARLFSGKELDNSFGKVMADTQRANTDIPLHQALYTYCQSWLVEDLLMKADKMTMANSIELRVPFLDHRLVEWAAQTPTWVKVGTHGRYQSKWVLRRFAETRVPKEIINRPKQGFPVPVYGWLANEIKPWVYDLLMASEAKIFDYLDKKVVLDYFDKGTLPDANVKAQHVLWHFAILELWMQEWLSNE
jgi:asparagine synthase (glutamine-hydrolysing)